MRLAFSLTFHRDLGSVETFLRTTFRPGHSFCLYVDAKAPESVHRGAEEVARCYRKHYPSANVFKLEDTVDVYWGHIRSGYRVDNW